MIQFNRFQQFLQRLTPFSRGNLLNELERLELCGIQIPGSEPVIALLRAEFRANGQAQKRQSGAARYFFAEFEPVLVDGAPEHANPGGIQRGSLPTIWEWISRDLLPTMARDYTKQITDLIAANRQSEARQAASVFQTKVIKSLENTLKSPESTAQIRERLAAYTASPSVFADLTKMASVLRARNELARLNEQLPTKLHKFESAEIDKVVPLLDAFAKTNPEQLPFALALVARRLKVSWQLLGLATKAAASKNATDVAATPYAVAVSMVLDRLEDKRSLLRIALKHQRILVAKEILIDVYDTEYALRARINELADSDWGRRLEALTASIAALVESEVSRFPENVGHVLGSRRLRSHPSLAVRMTYWVQKGHDALNGGVAFCKRVVG